MNAGIFDLGIFWAGQRSVVLVHYSLWLAEVGCSKVASANVEVVFSGAGRISMKSHSLVPAAPQRLYLPTLQLQVRLTSSETRGDCRRLLEALQ
jgi:hypothetical protein